MEADKGKQSWMVDDVYEGNRKVQDVETKVKM
jgi:hypothetical protein